MKPSERIKEIHDALKVLDNKEVGATPSYFEQAILDFLDEEDGTDGIKRRNKKI